jgi:hypothetical protein
MASKMIPHAAIAQMLIKLTNIKITGVRLSSFSFMPLLYTPLAHASTPFPCFFSIRKPLSILDLGEAPGQKICNIVRGKEQRGQLPRPKTNLPQCTRSLARFISMSLVSIHLHKKSIDSLGCGY